MLKIRNYGSTGRTAILLHGGPGAPGYMAPIGRALADSYSVIEPFQRESGGDPLTVAQHIADLDEVIAALPAGDRPALVGSSWGAMLALAYAAAHPAKAGPIVLIGCGTFSVAARQSFQSNLATRMDDELNRRVEEIFSTLESDNERLAALRDLLLPLYAFDPITTDLEYAGGDALGYEQSWRSMMRLQAEGVYPAAFTSIRSPVLMLHGDYDPYPADVVHASLRPYLPQMEYRLWKDCGHYPWIERAVHEEFFAVLRCWLKEKL